MKDERIIASKAEEMLGSSLRRETSGFRSHVYANSDAERDSLRYASAKARVKKYGLVKDGTASYYMRSLGIRMSRHGFVQHYGVDSIRQSGERTRLRPRSTTYGFKSHYMRMGARPFIDAAIEGSGVVVFVMRELTRNRSEELMLHVKRYMEKTL